MVQAIENWARLMGTVVHVAPSPSQSRFSLVVLDIETAEDVEGFPNLFTKSRGTQLSISVPAGLLTQMENTSNVRIECRVSRRSPRVVIAHREGFRVLGPRTET